MTPVAALVVALAGTRVGGVLPRSTRRWLRNGARGYEIESKLSPPSCGGGDGGPGPRPPGRAATSSLDGRVPAVPASRPSRDPVSGGGVGAWPLARPASSGEPSSQPERTDYHAYPGFVAPGAAEIGPVECTPPRSAGPRSWSGGTPGALVGAGAGLGDAPGSAGRDRGVPSRLPVSSVQEDFAQVAGGGTASRLSLPEPGALGPALPPLPSRGRTTQPPPLPACRSGAGVGGPERPSPHSTTPRPPLVGERPGRLETSGD